MTVFNENDYDAMLHGDSEDEASYALTPKGLLLAVMMKVQEDTIKDGSASDMDGFALVDKIWAEYEQFCRMHYGKGDQVGAVVFDGAGGQFASLETRPRDPNESEESEEL